MRSARVKAFAKINLSLEVLNKRPDGFHNLRTVFQTISLADTITIAAEQSRRTQIELRSNVEIPGENLIARAAHAVLDAMRMCARVEFDLQKVIPMGGGLGGGSTDAAAVLLALPALLGKRVTMERLIECGAQLGSDVPFFLLGGTVLGLGRGTELYALPEARRIAGLLIAPGVHVSTAEAYRALARTPDWSQPNRTEGTARAICMGEGVAQWGCSNDFEGPVSAEHKAIANAKRRLQRAGAGVALMSGSGSSVFGLFDGGPGPEQLDGAHRISLVSRTAYQRMWRRSLGCGSAAWPPELRA